MFNVVIAIEIKVHATTPLQEGGRWGACMQNVCERARGWVIVTHVAGCTERTWPPRFLSRLSNGGCCISAVAAAYRRLYRPGVDQTDRYELFPRNWSASQSWRKKLTAFPLPLPVILYYSLAQNAREVKWWIGGKPNKLRDNRALSCCLSRSCLIVFFFYLFSFSLWILLSTFHTLFISVKYNRIRGKFEVISSLDFNPAQGSIHFDEWRHILNILIRQESM